MNNLQHAFEEHLKNSGKSIHTQEVYRRNVRKFFEYYKEKPIQEITAQDIEKYLESRKAEGIEPKTYNLIITSLRYLYKFYQEKEGVEDPTSGLKTLELKVHEKDKTEITKRIDRFIDLVKKTKNFPIRDKTIILMMAYLGLSSTEVLSIDLKGLKIEKKKLVLSFYSIREKEKVSLEIKYAWALADFFRIIQDYLALRLCIDTKNEALFITENNTRIERFYFNKIFSKMCMYAHVENIRSSDLRYSGCNILKTIGKKSPVAKVYQGEVLENRYKLEKSLSKDHLSEIHAAFDLESKKKVRLTKWNLNKKMGLDAELIKNILSLQNFITDKKIAFPIARFGNGIKHLYLVYEDARSTTIFFVDEFIRSLFNKPYSDCIMRQWFIARKELDYTQIPGKEMTAIVEKLFKHIEPLEFSSELFIMRGKHYEAAESFLSELASRVNAKVISCQYEELGYPLYVELLRKIDLSADKQTTQNLLRAPLEKKRLLQILAQKLIEKLLGSILIVQSDELLPDDISFFEAFFRELREIADKQILLFWITSSEEVISFLMEHSGVVIGSAPKITDKIKIVIEKKDFDLFKLLVVYRRPCPVSTLYKIIQKPDFISRLFFYVREGILIFREDTHHMCIGIRDYSSISSLVLFGKNEEKRFHKQIVLTFGKELSLSEKLEFLGHLRGAKRPKEAFLYFREIAADLKEHHLSYYILSLLPQLKYTQGKSQQENLIRNLRLFAYTANCSYDKAIALVRKLIDKAKDDRMNIEYSLLLREIYAHAKDVESQMLSPRDLLQDEYKLIVDTYAKGENTRSFELINEFLKKYEEALGTGSLEKQYQWIRDPIIFDVIRMKQRLVKAIPIEHDNPTLFDIIVSLMYSSFFIERIQRATNENLILSCICDEFKDRLNIEELGVVSNNFGRLKLLSGNSSKEIIHLVQRILYTKERALLVDSYLGIRTSLLKKELFFVFRTSDVVQRFSCIRLLSLIEEFVGLQNKA